MWKYCRGMEELRTIRLYREKGFQYGKTKDGWIYDQADIEFLRSLKAQIGQVDIIIENDGHIMNYLIF